MARDEPGGNPVTGQVVPGMEAARVWSAAFTRNVGRRPPIPRARPGRGGRARGSAPGGRNRKALSTVAASAGGPARSSGEALVIGAERRGRLIYWFVRTSNRASPGRRRVSRSGPEGKPFQIPKQLVWEAYRRVRANKGAAGVDGESIAGLESGLRDNLCKIWNRMTSGTYFPPPVMAVEIPKSGGGARTLGVPTEAA